MEKLDCNTCKYKWWDCKNCYELQGEDESFSGKPNLIFTIVLTRECNFRCSYCAIDFSQDTISKDVIAKNIILSDKKPKDTPIGSPSL